MLSGDWALIAMGGNLLLLPHISCRRTADPVQAVTSGPINSQQCDRSTNYYWKGEDKREAYVEIWKAIGGGVRVIHQQCWQCQSGDICNGWAMSRPSN